MKLNSTPHHIINSLKMDIGNPEREYIVEPVEDPVPREVPVPEPEREREAPEPVHAPSE